MTMSMSTSHHSLLDSFFYCFCLSSISCCRINIFGIYTQCLVKSRSTLILSKMKVIVKKLQGGECCLEVLPTTQISEMKRQIAEQLHIPVEEQKLLLLGRTLVDEQTVEAYPTIKDGTKLNLVVKKPDSFLETSVKYFKRTYSMTETEATTAAKRLVKILQDKCNKLSWDDLDRVSLDCMLEENGQSRSPPMEIEPECDDVYSL